MASYYPEGKTWTVAYRPKGQPRQYVYGIRTERLAKQTRDAKTLEEQLVKTGLHKPETNAHKLSRAEATEIEKHIAEFRKSILNEGTTKQHADQQAHHVRRLVGKAKVARLSEIEAEKIQAAAKKLMDEDGFAPRTANAAIVAMRQFSTWCFTSDRTKYDLLHRRLVTYNQAVDVRRRRRALSQEEFSALVGNLLSGKDRNNRCGINRLDRAMLYQTGLGTGFRQRALLSLHKTSMYVGRGNRPFIELGASHNKNGKERRQPIRRDLADALLAWLKTKPIGPLWNKSPYADLALRFRRDMEEARAAYVAAGSTPAERQEREKSTFLSYVYDDGRGKVWADFHGLRHTGITFVVRTAGLKEGQAWADHSTPVLTAKYAHMDLADEDRMLESLPGPVKKHDPAPAPAQLRHCSQQIRTDLHNRKRAAGGAA